MIEQSAAAVERPRLWAARAGVAERGVWTRHLHRAWWMPATLLGTTRWPATSGQRWFVWWNYWWQAHLLDCVVDAQLRRPTVQRVAAVRALTRGIRLRNITSWTNRYYDDVAWLGLALHRASKVTGVDRPRALAAVARQLRGGWTAAGGGGIWWRRRDNFKNVPANGPAAILFVRLAAEGPPAGEPGDLGRARDIAEWIETHLVDPRTGLVWDGLRVNRDGSVRDVEKAVYTYCQGVLLGAYVELADATGDPTWTRRAMRTIDAVAQHLTSQEGVLRGHGGGDGGLFTGILTRYLAQAALRLYSAPEARHQAADLVLLSAEGAWRNRAGAPGGPLFGPDWTMPASVPDEPRPHRAGGGSVRSVAPAEQDLSVQLSGWMVLEAAALLERSGLTARRQAGL
ncbi:glycoside hydrolase family 76 protein [Streptoalloteichus hindustanus]|uniref:Predicted alpha-1,6-mannanase, GH76 family n=1 Tax=Streptoalloteichus hindustanus TaxID=2017 RepID=A0A1M4UIC2_STRHI|nr:glycoside hydrolase family 76 protein [Streptoalloteichus hindustanus]SHE56310.1 Predicted alpha-1,6-mannanase, GH76 family [Streptoalloteichus hindustanus]